MADSKISALPASTTPLAGTEVLPIVQSSTTRQVSVANLTAGRAISATQLTLTTGNLIVASGQGIDFSATSQPAGMTSELFNDYEEGTWTPTFFLGATEASYASRSGTYTKTGRTVYATCTISLSSKNSGTGGLSIGGLPFTVKSGVDGMSTLWPYSGWVLLIASGCISIQAAGGGAIVYLYVQTTTGNSQLTDGATSATSVMQFSLTYVV